VTEVRTTKKVGLALSGGGARAFSHLGALQVLIENGIPIDVIAGTSAGSILGAAFASGMSIDEISQMAERMRWSKLTRLSLSPMGLLTNAPMGAFLQLHLPVTRFEDLKIPYGAVVCDFDTGKELVLKESGSLVEAVRASCAVPGIFVPVKRPDGSLLIDGGVLSPVPTDAARAMGAEIVIAIDLLSCGSTFVSTPRTALGVMLQTSMMMLRAASRAQAYSADVVISPAIAHLRPDQIGKRDEFIQLGAAAAKQQLPRLRSLLF
jgi:NTE family protein